MTPYDNKDMTGWDLRDRQDMDGLTIEGLCLSQCVPSDVLPPTLTGTVFLDCNLDNVRIPQGNLLLRGLNRFYLVQDDGEDWEIDADGNPIKILGT